VLLHELTHIQRWDCLTQLVSQLVRACFWFHPLVWWAVERTRVEQERACDEAVLQSGTNAADYAQHLLAVLARVPAGYFAPGVALAMGRRGRRERRLLGILQFNGERKPPSRALRMFVCGAALLLLLPVAALRFQVQATPAPDAEKTAQEDKKPAPPQSLAEIR